MTELDKALEALNANPEDPKAQSGFYDRFLNTIFFVPLGNETMSTDDENAEKKVELPLIFKNDDADFLVFFDEQKRLNDWAEQVVRSAQMPGYVLVEISSPDLWWAMNVGTDHDKQFPPAEIAWLKGIIAASKTEAD